VSHRVSSLLPAMVVSLCCITPAALIPQAGSCSFPFLPSPPRQHRRGERPFAPTRPHVQPVGVVHPPCCVFLDGDCRDQTRELHSPVPQARSIDIMTLHSVRCMHNNSKCSSLTFPKGLTRWCPFTPTLATRWSHIYGSWQMGMTPLPGPRGSRGRHLARVPGWSPRNRRNLFEGEKTYAYGDT
jgi:hypothetical protein